MKNIVTVLDKFLNNVSFLNRTRLVLFVLAFGMVCICFLTFVSLFALKYDHEMLYENHISSIQKLEEINTLYNCRGLRHELSSSAGTMGSWVSIPLEA